MDRPKPEAPRLRRDTEHSHLCPDQSGRAPQRYTRDSDGQLGIQSAVLLEGVDASIEIPELGLVLPFSALYEGLELASDPAAAP